MSEYEFWDELGNIFNAIVAYQQKTIEFNKRFVTPWIKLGTVFDQNDHNAEALQAHKKAINIDQDSADNWLSLGDVYFKMGSFDDAASAYRKAIELNPKLGWAYANLALTCLTQQNYTVAVNLYVKSLEFISDEQDRAMIWNRLGNAYRKVNDYQNAFIAFQMADECDEQNTGFKDQLDEVTMEQRVMPIVAEVYVNDKTDQNPVQTSAVVEAPVESQIDPAEVSAVVEEKTILDEVETAPAESDATVQEEPVNNQIIQPVEPVVEETIVSVETETALPKSEEISEKLVDESVIEEDAQTTEVGTTPAQSEEATEEPVIEDNIASVEMEPTLTQSEEISTEPVDEPVVDENVPLTEAETVSAQSEKVIDTPLIEDITRSVDTVDSSAKPHEFSDETSVTEPASIEMAVEPEIQQNTEIELTDNVLTKAESLETDSSTSDDQENESTEVNEAISAEMIVEVQPAEENVVAVENETDEPVEAVNELGDSALPSTTPISLSDTSNPQADKSATSTADWLIYTNSAYGFQFRYPLQIQAFNPGTEVIFINLPISDGTNLGEKYLEVTVAQNINMCQSPFANSSILQTSETVIVNGTAFLKQTGGDAGLGNCRDWVAYSTSRDNTCVSMGFVLHYTNADTFDPPVAEFDREAESAVFNQMMSTFEWLTVPLAATSNSVLDNDVSVEEMKVDIVVEASSSEEVPIDSSSQEYSDREDSSDTTMTPVMSHSVETYADLSLFDKPVVLVVEDLADLIVTAAPRSAIESDTDVESGKEIPEVGSSTSSATDNATIEPSVESVAADPVEVVNETEPVQVTSETEYEKFFVEAPDTAVSSAEANPLESQPVTNLKIEPDTKNAHIWNELGNVYFNTGALEEAVSAYSKAIELDDWFAWPYSNLALVYVQKEKYADAILLYQRSIELFASDKDKAITWNRLGNVYRRLNDYENAITCYQRADNLDPNNATRSLRSRFSLLGSLNIEQATSLAI